MTKFFNNVGGKKIFSRKSSSATHNFIWVLAPCENLAKTNNTIPRNERMIDPIS